MKKYLNTLLLPELNNKTVLIVTLNYLEGEINLQPNYYYQVIDETTLVNKKLVSLQLIIILDLSGEYFLIVNESSAADRWRTAGDMTNYFNTRLQYLAVNKKNIFITSEYKDEENFLLQYYVYAGKSEFRHIAALVRKIVNQVNEFRNNYERNK